MNKNLMRFITSIIYLIVGGFALAISFGAFSSPVTKDAYIYFTVIANYACILYTFIELIYNVIVSIKHRYINYITILPETKFCLTTSIFVMFVIANTVLGGQIGYIWTFSYWVNINNIFFHFILPILFVVSFFYYSDHRFTYLTPFKQLILPCGYLGMLLIRGTILGWDEMNINIIPYDFINPRVVGYPQAIFSLFGVVSLFVIIGYIVIFIDRYIKNKEFRKKVDNTIVYNDDFDEENDDEDED